MKTEELLEKCREYFRGKTIIADAEFLFWRWPRPHTLHGPFPERLMDECLDRLEKAETDAKRWQTYKRWEAERVEHLSDTATIIRFRGPVEDLDEWADAEHAKQTEQDAG